MQIIALKVLIPILCAVLYIILQYEPNPTLTLVWYISFLVSCGIILWEVGNLILRILRSRSLLGISLYLWLLLFFEIVFVVPTIMENLDSIANLTSLNFILSNGLYLYRLPLGLSSLVITIILMIRSRR